jgi:hypothetical protein
MEGVAQRIALVRGQRVMLDADLAAMYQVETRALIQAVKRNRARFPDDFMFQLDATEVARLKSQSVMSNARGRGGRRHAPYAFTEQGVAMLSTVLRSPRAIAVNIEIMRAFVRLRLVLASNEEFRRRFDELERRLDRKLTTHDQAIAGILDAIRQLMTPSQRKGGAIGFTADIETHKP